MISNKTLLRVISLLLTITFFTGQISNAYAYENLGASLLSDGTLNPDRTEDGRNDISHKLEPGAVGDGRPLVALSQGKLPARVKLEDSAQKRLINKKINEAIEIALKAYLSKKDEIPQEHRKRTKKASQRLVSLNAKLSKHLYLFDAVIELPKYYTEGPECENYLVGFNHESKNWTGLSVELIDYLYDISPKRLAQYVYHECVPEHIKHVTNRYDLDREDHRIIYREIQSVIFGDEEVKALGQDLRNFVERKMQDIKEMNSFGFILPEGVIPISGNLLCKTPEGLDELRLLLKQNGYEVKETCEEADEETYKESPRKLREEKMFYLWSAKFSDDNFEVKGKCRACESLISIEDIETHKHKCEVCGDYTFLQFVEGRSAVNVEFIKSGVFVQDLVVHHYDEINHILYFFRNIEDIDQLEKMAPQVKAGVKASYKTVDEKLKEAEGDFQIVKVDGIELIAVRYNSYLSDGEREKAISNGEEDIKIIGSIRWVQVRHDKESILKPPFKKFPGHKFVSIYEMWHNDLLEPSPTLHEKIMKFGGISSDKGTYYQDGRPAPIGDYKYREMRRFVEHFTTLDVDKWDEMISRAPKDGPGLVETIAKFCHSEPQIKDSPSIGHLFTAAAKIQRGENLTEGEKIAMRRGLREDPGADKLDMLQLLNDDFVKPETVQKIISDHDSSEVRPIAKRMFGEDVETGDLVNVSLGTDASSRYADTIREELKEIGISDLGADMSQRTLNFIRMLISELGLLWDLERKYESLINENLPQKYQKLKGYKHVLSAWRVAPESKNLTTRVEEVMKREGFNAEEIAEIKALVLEVKLNNSFDTDQPFSGGEDSNQVKEQARTASIDWLVEYAMANRHIGHDKMIRDELASDPKYVNKLEEFNKVFAIAVENQKAIKARAVRDFHVHSNCSDGLFSPAELVKYAAEEGVSQLALADHDTIEGLDEAQKAAQQFGIDFVTGVELSTKFHGKNVHILGYGFDPVKARQDKEFIDELDKVKENDHKWAWEMCEKSQENPIVVTTEDGKQHKIFVTKEEIEEFKGTMPSAFHMGLVISRKLAAISEELDIPARYAFYIFFRRLEPDRVLESYAPEVIEQYKPLLEKYKIHLPPEGYWRVERTATDLQDTEKAVKGILRIGGIPVLAHPGEQKLSEEDIAGIAKMGIKGIEIYSYKHSPEEIQRYNTITQKYGLFVTSGTDFHDPYHRAKVKVGKDRKGQVLSKGCSIGDFKAMGANVYLTGDKTLESLIEKAPSIQAFTFDVGDTLAVKTKEDPKGDMPTNEVIEALADLVNLGKNVSLVTAKADKSFRGWIEEKLFPQLDKDKLSLFIVYGDRVTKIYQLSDKGKLKEASRIIFPKSADKDAILKVVQETAKTIEKALFADESISDGIKSILVDNPVKAKAGDEYVQLASKANIQIKGDKTSGVARSIIRDMLEKALQDAGLLTEDIMVVLDGKKGAYVKNKQADKPGAIRHLQSVRNLTPDQIVYVADQFAGKSTADLTVAETGVHCVNVGVDKQDEHSNIYNAENDGPEASIEFIDLVKQEVLYQKRLAKLKEFENRVREDFMPGGPMAPKISWFLENYQIDIRELPLRVIAGSLEALGFRDYGNAWYRQENGPGLTGEAVEEEVPAQNIEEEEIDSKIAAKITAIKAEVEKEEYYPGKFSDVSETAAKVLIELFEDASTWKEDDFTLNSLLSKVVFREDLPNAVKSRVIDKLQNYGKTLRGIDLLVRYFNHKKVKEWTPEKRLTTLSSIWYEAKQLKKNLIDVLEEELEADFIQLDKFNYGPAVELTQTEIQQSSDKFDIGEIEKELNYNALYFSSNIFQVLSKDREKTFILAIDSDIGSEQQGRIMPLYRAVDKLMNMKDAEGNPLFPNLKVVREKGANGALVREIKDQFENPKDMDDSAIFMVVKQANLIQGEFKGIEENAWMTAIDDSNATRFRDHEGDYIPIFEAATLAMMAAMDADLDSIKLYYDKIAANPVSREKLKIMLKKRIILLLPKATEVKLNNLRDVYNLAEKIFIAA